MLKSVSFGLVAIVGMFAGSFAMAEGLTIDCKLGVLDLSQATSFAAGKERNVHLTDFSQEDRSFMVHISPAGGLTQLQAQNVAMSVSDITCMHLDAHPMPVKLPALVGDSWQVASGCEGHWVRIEGQC